MLGFRVWGVSSGEMILPESHDNEFSISASGELMYNDEFVEKELWIPMQQTALTDMENRPIYQKDILWLSKNGGYYIVDSIYELFLHYFTEGSGKLYYHEIGIIGNVFENPELLEKIK